MKKKLTIIISCCAMMAISVVLLLVFVVVKPDEKPTPLYCTAKDVDLCVGNTVYDYYDLSNENASLSIYVNKDNIIDINDQMIYGKYAGEVEVTLTATYGEEKSVTVFYVNVHDESYRLEVTPMNDCYLEGNTLYAQSNICQFKFEVFDALGQKLSNSTYQITTTENTIINRNFDILMLTLLGESVLTIEFPDLGFEFILYIVVE